MPHISAEFTLKK